MSKFGANTFWIATTFNYLWSSAVCKSQCFKVDNFVFPIFLLSKLRSVFWVEKTPISFFSTFSSKIDEFGQKKSEKIKKIQKNSKNLKVASNYPSI